MPTLPGGRSSSTCVRPIPAPLRTSLRTADTALKRHPRLRPRLRPGTAHMPDAASIPSPVVALLIAAAAAARPVPS